MSSSLEAQTSPSRLKTGAPPQPRLLPKAHCKQLCTLSKERGAGDAAIGLTSLNVYAALPQGASPAPLKQLVMACRAEYVHLYTQWRLGDSIKEQLSAFRTGFMSVSNP